MIKKRSLSHQTMEGYLRAVKRLMTAVNKPLDQIGTVDIDWYLSQYVTSMYYAQSTQKTLRNIRERIAA